MPGYSKSILSTGDQDNKYNCIHCNLLLRDPHQSYCGHRLCMTCIDELMRGTGVHECPICGPDEEISTEDSMIAIERIFRDNGIKREMRTLKTKCANVGCTWKGVFHEYEKHEVKCDYALIQCSNKGCEEKARRCDLDYHLKISCCVREVECSHCRRRLQFKNMENHLVECPMAPTPCGFCGKKIIREKMKEHTDFRRGDCPRKMAPCKYDMIGCTTLVELGKEDIHASDDIGHHLELIFQEVSKFNTFRESIESNLGGIKRLTVTVHHQAEMLNTLQRQISMLEKDLKERSQVATNQSPNGLHLQRYEHLLKKLTQSNGELQNKSVVLEKKVSTYEEIVAVLNTEVERSAEIVQAMKNDDRKIREWLEALEKKTKAQDRIIALKDVTLAEQDLRIQSLEMTSYDGILNWKISQFGRKRRDAISGRTLSIYSPYFFTGRYGYKMCARIYLNGDGMGKGNHVSLFFVIMKGEYDAVLKWPFKQKVTFMWIDQNNREHMIDAFRPDPTSSSFKRPTGDMNIASGCPLFMPLNIIESGRQALVKDDTAFIRISVDTSDL
ncbi:TNF receptor-associated factor 2-like [Glandiceps talaboti]